MLSLSNLIFTSKIEVLKPLVKLRYRTAGLRIKCMSADATA